MIIEQQTILEKDPTKSSAWTFIVFLRDGRSIVSPATYDSEARARGRISERELKFSCRYPDYLMQTGDVEWRWGEYSHSIPVPKTQP